MVSEKPGVMAPLLLLKTGWARRFVVHEVQPVSIPLLQEVHLALVGAGKSVAVAPVGNRAPCPPWCGAAGKRSSRPCTSLDYTARPQWLGGFKRNRTARRTLETLRAMLDPHFTLVRTLDLPFLIREHARKFQWSVALATVWVRR